MATEQTGRTREPLALTPIRLVRSSNCLYLLPATNLRRTPNSSVLLRVSV